MCLLVTEQRILFAPRLGRSRSLLARTCMGRRWLSFDMFTLTLSSTDM